MSDIDQVHTHASNKDPNSKEKETDNKEKDRARPPRGRAVQPLTPEEQNVVKDFSYCVEIVLQKILRRLPPWIDVPRLRGAGILGLIYAAKKFDPKQEETFKNYVFKRVRGQILDELRNMDFLSRRARAYFNLYTQTYHSLYQAQGSPPTDDQMAKALDVPLAKVLKIKKIIQPIVFHSLQESFPTQASTSLTPQTWQDILKDESAKCIASSATAKDFNRILQNKLKSLAPRYQYLMQLYYFEDKTLAEIGVLLNISEARACQIHQKALSILRKTLSEDFSMDFL